MSRSAAIDAVTLDDLHRLAPWDPNHHLYALVDMGSNGIRFSISDLSPPRARLMRCLYRERAAISLFDALHHDADDADHDSFPAATVALVARTVARFHRIAVADYGVAPANFDVFATEAMRRAANAAAMVDALRAAVPSLRMHVLAPEVETLFGAVGARSAFLDPHGLFLDLGGGSVQMTYMDSREEPAGSSAAAGPLGFEVAAARAGQSLPFGAARLSRILQSADSHVQAAETASLRSGMRGAFDALCARFPSLAAAEDIDVYLCGGGFRGYGAMLMHTDAIQPYPLAALGSYTVAGAAFAQTARLRALNASHAGKVFDMSRRRRAQFPAIATVVEALLAAVPRIRSATFCAGGNREGALLMKLPRAVREENPLDLMGGRPQPDEGEGETRVRQAVLETLRSALPADAGASITVFSLRLGGLLAGLIWRRAGERDEANASTALHDACARDPSGPGLTHLARAVLAVALCVRWGAALAPADRALYRGLRAVAARADPAAVFWAEYVGAAAAAVAMVVPAWPRAAERLHRSIRLVAVVPFLRRRGAGLS